MFIFLWIDLLVVFSFYILHFTSFFLDDLICLLVFNISLEIQICITIHKLSLLNLILHLLSVIIHRCPSTASVQNIINRIHLFPSKSVLPYLVNGISILQLSLWSLPCSHLHIQLVVKSHEFYPPSHSCVALLRFSINP